MTSTRRMKAVRLLVYGLLVIAPLSAMSKTACGVDGARVLLDFDVMHPPTEVLHLGTRLDIKVIYGFNVGLDVRNRQTGEPIFDEPPHGKPFYEVSASEARHEQRDEKIRVLETWIYAVILYIDYRDLRVRTDDRGYDQFVGGRVRVCVRGKSN